MKIGHLIRVYFVPNAALTQWWIFAFLGAIVGVMFSSIFSKSFPTVQPLALDNPLLTTHDISNEIYEEYGPAIHVGRGPGGNYIASDFPTALLSISDGYRPLDALSIERLSYFHTCLDFTDSKSAHSLIKSFLLSQDLSKTTLVVWMTYDWITDGRQPWNHIIVDHYRWTPHRAVEFRLVNSVRLYESLAVECRWPQNDNNVVHPDLEDLRDAILGTYPGIWLDSQVLLLRPISSSTTCKTSSCFVGEKDDGYVAMLKVANVAAFRSDLCRKGPTRCKNCFDEQATSIKLTIPECNLSNAGSIFNRDVSPMAIAFPHRQKCSLVERRGIYSLKVAIMRSIDNSFTEDARIVETTGQFSLNSVIYRRPPPFYKRTFYSFNFFILSMPKSKDWRTAHRQNLRGATIGVSANPNLHAELLMQLVFVIPVKGVDQETKAALLLENAIHDDMLFSYNTNEEDIAKAKDIPRDTVSLNNSAQLLKEDFLTQVKIGGRFEVFEEEDGRLRAFQEALLRWVERYEGRWMVFIHKEDIFISEIGFANTGKALAGDLFNKKEATPRFIMSLSKERPLPEGDLPIAPCDIKGCNAKVVKDYPRSAFIKSDIGLFTSRDAVPLLYPPTNPINFAIDKKCENRAKILSLDMDEDLINFCKLGESHPLVYSQLINPSAYRINKLTALRPYKTFNEPFPILVPGDMNMTIVDITALANDTLCGNNIGWHNDVYSVLNYTLAINNIPCSSLFPKIDLLVRLNTLNVTWFTPW